MDWFLYDRDLRQERVKGIEVDSICFIVTVAFSRDVYYLTLHKYQVIFPYT